MRKYLYLLITALAWAAGPQRTVPAINEVDRSAASGQQPYELTWTDRNEHPRTLADFEDLSGWKLDLYEGASGELRRSREQQMWGQYVARIAYSGSGQASRVVARPPKPVPIPGRFDTVEMWVFCDRMAPYSSLSAPAGARAPYAPSHLSILIEDSRGRKFRLPMNELRWAGWWLVMHKVPAEMLREIVGPASFSGIEVTAPNSAQRYLFCDSLAFYAEELKPLAFKPQPRRNLKPFRGQIAGLNTGPGVLPFPTREQTILPSNFERDFRAGIRQTSPGTFQFEYKGRDATVVYEYAPKTGSLSEITVRVNGGPPFRPLDGGGVRLENTPEGQVAAGELLSAVLNGDAVETKFRAGSQVIEYEIRLWQKSLVLEVRCGRAREIVFGRVAGARDPSPITVPYITYSHFNPRVLMSGEAGRRVFTSVWFDWYRSNSSEPFFVRQPRVTVDSAEINGGLRYIPKTDGARNPVYERIFVTNSPVYEEVLPTIPNPPSLRQAEGSQAIWTVSQPETFPKDHPRCRLIRSYGLDRIMQHSHEVTWRDGSDSYTMRLRAAPQKGGDRMLEWYIRAQNSLGWLQGVYTNYCDFAPVNTNWDPDFVQRMPDGEFRRAWYRTYALKPAKAVEMDEYYAPRIKERYGVKMSYTDVHTDNPPPWEYCDYDARVPGAGTFAATFYAYGQLLLNDQRIYGPTQSESTFQWLFAGLQSGGYGWVYTDVNLLTHPLDIAFRLHKIHPLECDYGMGQTDYYLSRLDRGWKTSAKKRDYVDLFLSTTIGYGNMGWLVTDWGLDDPFGVEVMARSYYMMQQLQQQYAFQPPARIEYGARDGRMLTPSQAHATGEIAGSRLHIEYANGTHVYVNRGASGAWTVADGRGRAVELPPYGWLAYRAENGFYEASANVEGRRIDYVKAPEFEFLDGRGQWTERGNLGAAGSVALRAKSGGRLELIDIYGNGQIAFKSDRSGAVSAYDPEGRSLGSAQQVVPRDGWIRFSPRDGARSYVFAPAP